MVVESNWWTIAGPATSWPLFRSARSYCRVASRVGSPRTTYVTSDSPVAASAGSGPAAAPTGASPSYGSTPAPNAWMLTTWIGASS